ncbi:DUF4032 domain-containing protein [Corynebacterium minutissimum]|uniref:Lipopolysaccharide kinase (Kdo/WaaP) family n=1 Tax=Corynebacterium minutissimum TaxID=38301 RepID=A0A376CZ76_9CORY|nr:DUF4032 domain-containing protein [Corynebacterium minutissimum]QRP61018.1 DUF4032 domain-containing protein [Corynebacterium minutissimum]STC78138.1 Lipopolysaccharide kinase (Kdo/WaaP) family [Corynebacterium minutissimum]
MKESMSITSSTYASALLTLPWDTPLEQWPDKLIAALPRGISRHIVRFVGVERGIIAVKEIGVRTAHHEYKMLRELQRLGAPSVRPVAVITGRQPADEEYGELTAALVTEHLEFSLPYREIFSRQLTTVEAEKLIRALSVLLVRMHLLSFYWGDVSLSNTLFRRDAETYSAYLVDAETGEFQPNLSESRRLYDVDIARVNIIGELMDLQAGDYLDTGIDVIALGSLVESSYLELWEELTAEESVDASEYWKVSERIDRLNQLGFDVGELKVSKDASKHTVRIRPVVVDPGHYRAQLLSLTGLSVEEHQAQRLLSSIQAYQAVECSPHVSLTQAAHRWMTQEYEPTIAAIPDDLLGKLEPAQVFHEITDHRWFLSQDRGEAVSLAEATESYLATVLPSRRDEARLLRTVSRGFDAEF